MNLILASSSPYRKQLLKRLGLEFECQSPNINEEINPNLSVAHNAQILATKKAQTVAENNDESVVIGSDQICSFNDQVFGKPKNFTKAFEQLKSASNNKVCFYTAVCVINTKHSEIYEFINQTEVYFRNLHDHEIENYLKKEQPFNCAGSFKAESLGICLFDKIKSNDPTALIGLPLIQLNHVLMKIGINPLGEKIE